MRWACLHSLQKESSCWAKNIKENTGFVSTTMTLKPLQIPPAHLISYQKWMKCWTITHNNKPYIKKKNSLNSNMKFQRCLKEWCSSHRRLLQIWEHRGVWYWGYPQGGLMAENMAVRQNAEGQTARRAWALWPCLYCWKGWCGNRRCGAERRAS